MIAQSKKMILIVDDQPAWRMTFSLILEENSFNVISAGSYEEAMNILESHTPFHVAIVDKNLNGDNPDEGLELINHIKQMNVFTNTIVITGYPTISTARRAFRELCVFDYIEKLNEEKFGFDTEHFIKIVREAAYDADSKIRAGALSGNSATIFNNSIKIFICYAREDLHKAYSLYNPTTTLSR
ncbi:MAG: response regulator [Desulfobacteraceae bacterium]|nr:response regulator [Desulfobacteraceae bacterium]